MDMTIVLSLHKFIPQATIDHRGLSMYLVYYITPINSRKKKPYYCSKRKIVELEMNDMINISTAFVVMYKLIT